MEKTATTEMGVKPRPLEPQPLEPPPVVRAGRPPREFAAEVDTRILDAARSVFLERGLAGASMDEIAEKARAGKRTIYARFPNKEALFTAVVMRNIADNIARFEDQPPTGATIEERIVSVVVPLLQWVLAGDAIKLMRVAIAEASRFPDLASSVHRMARERGAEAVARLLSEVACGDPGDGSMQALRPEPLAKMTQIFRDLVFLPLLLRGLFGEQLASLRAEVGPHVARTVAFFLAAARNGGFD
jgi:AcrR family transcriptional regulator